MIPKRVASLSTPLKAWQLLRRHIRVRRVRWRRTSWSAWKKVLTTTTSSCRSQAMTLQMFLPQDCHPRPLKQRTYPTFRERCPVKWYLKGPLCRPPLYKVHIISQRHRSVMAQKWTKLLIKIQISSQVVRCRCIVRLQGRVALSRDRSR